jgi:cell division protease FtsH
MKEQKNPRKPFIYYYMIVMLLIILLNATVFPYFRKVQSKIVEIDYGTFLNMVEAGEVTTVEIDSKQIAFLTDKDEETVYITGKFEDPMLVDRLRSAGKDIKFDRLIEKETNTLLSALMSWVLPLAFFIGIGQLLSRQMQKRMGTTMQFGTGVRGL